MSILQHRRNVRERAKLRAVLGRQPFAHERPRASLRDGSADEVIRELPEPVPVPRATPVRKKRKAKAKAKARRVAS